MSAKAIWFTSFLHCSRKGPDRARKDHGYVYAAFFNSGEIKVGSTYHPRVRFKDMVNLQYDFGSANIAVVPCGSKFRSIETEFHQVMRPLRVSGRRRGVCRYEEVYKTPDYPLNCLVLKYIEAGCCPRVLETIDARVIELAASKPLKFCPNCAAISA